MATAPDVKAQPVGNLKNTLTKAAQRRMKNGKVKTGRVKGKYVGKEKYGGLTKNAPKGKYKGKYIGPDRFKGDAAAYQKYKDEKLAKRIKKVGKKISIPKGGFKNIPPNTPTPKPGVITTH